MSGTLFTHKIGSEVLKAPRMPWNKCASPTFFGQGRHVIVIGSGKNCIFRNKVNTELDGTLKENQQHLGKIKGILGGAYYQLSVSSLYHITVLEH